jgi:hypothetical protein
VIACGIACVDENATVGAATATVGSATATVGAVTDETS